MSLPKFVVGAIGSGFYTVEVPANTLGPAWAIFKLSGDMHTQDHKQRFGRLVQSYGDYGELRRQKKEPHKEVFYIPVILGQKYSIEKDENSANVVLRSIQNCTSDQLTDHIRKVGKHLEAAAISQANAEYILDLLYAELGNRVKP